MVIGHKFWRRLARTARAAAAAVFAAGFGLPAAAQDAALEELLAEASSVPSLQAVIVARDGTRIAEKAYGGHSLTKPTNIKSASKTVIAALVGAAIDRGVIEGVDQPMADILRDDVPDEADPRIKEITVGNLLSMQAGLEPPSGANYGRWVLSDNWVRSALEQPFIDDPGGRMLYSTGSSHLLSAILTEATGKSTRANARAWFSAVEDFSIAGWERDPQGVYMGGNQMAMSPRALLAFGEVFRARGLAPNGERVLSEKWIEQSWMVRTYSRYTGDGYGYGWFIGNIANEDVRYAWGYGGQMLYVLPDLGLTVVMTSDETPRATTISHRDRLHGLLADIIEAVRDGEA